MLCTNLMTIVECCHSSYFVVKISFQDLLNILLVSFMDSNHANITPPLMTLYTIPYRINLFSVGEYGSPHVVKAGLHLVHF